MIGYCISWFFWLRALRSSYGIGTMSSSLSMRLSMWSGFLLCLVWLLMLSCFSVSMNFARVAIMRLIVSSSRSSRFLPLFRTAIFASSALSSSCSALSFVFCRALDSLFALILFAMRALDSLFALIFCAILTVMHISIASTIMRITPVCVSVSTYSGIICISIVFHPFGLMRFTMRLSMFGFGGNFNLYSFSSVAINSLRVVIM